MPDAEHWAILIPDAHQWAVDAQHWAITHIVLSHIDAWYKSLRQKNESIIDAWCTALSHILMPDSIEPWMHSIEPYDYYWYIWCKDIEPYDMSDAQHWAIEPYWSLSHSIELFWCLVLCCIKLSSLHLNWARKMQLWTMRMRKLRNMASMVDSRRRNLGFISRRKASWW